MEMKSFLSGSIISHDLSLTKQLIFISHQTFQTYRSSGMDLSCTDPYLCAESIAESIGKPGGTVLINPGRIH